VLTETRSWGLRVHRAGSKDFACDVDEAGEQLLSDVRTTQMRSSRDGELLTGYWFALSPAKSTQYTSENRNAVLGWLGASVLDTSFELLRLHLLHDLGNLPSDSEGLRGLVLSGILAAMNDGIAFAVTRRQALPKVVWLSEK